MTEIKHRNPSVSRITTIASASTIRANKQARHGHHPSTTPSIKRVAAYCRVSTNLEIQQSSLEIQMFSFRNMINEHPDWELAGIYADQGITGTSMKRRKEFLRMIDDAKKGKIDYILAKSISRFARDTVTLLSVTRELKDVGVFVFFEKEKLDTHNINSEMLLTIHASFAQEESHTISENMKWGFRKRFQEGQPKWSSTYGFSRSNRADWIINKEEANIVRRIFLEYYEGKSFGDISKMLNDEGIPAPSHASYRKTKGWWLRSVQTILANEKYIGDLRMQKTYGANHMTQKIVKNNGVIVPMYYVSNAHPAIIDKELFDNAQLITAMNNTHNGCTQYPYYGTLICPACGNKLIRFRLNSRAYEGAWMCGRQGECELSQVRPDCHLIYIYEQYIHRGFWTALDGLDKIKLREIASNHVFGREKKTRAAEIALEFMIKRGDRSSKSNWDRDTEIPPVKYYHLHQMINKMTFKVIDGDVHWDILVITWKFGITTETNLEFFKISDIPGIVIEKIKTERGIKYFANGQQVINGHCMKIGLDNVHRFCQKIIITHPIGNQLVPSVITPKSEMFKSDGEIR